MTFGNHLVICMYTQKFPLKFVMACSCWSRAISHASSCCLPFCGIRSQNYFHSTRFEHSPHDFNLQTQMSVLMELHYVTIHALILLAVMSARVWRVTNWTRMDTAALVRSSHLKSLCTLHPHIGGYPISALCSLHGFHTTTPTVPLMSS